MQREGQKHTQHPTIFTHKHTNTHTPPTNTHTTHTHAHTTHTHAHKSALRLQSS